MFQRLFGGARQSVRSITVQEAWARLAHPDAASFIIDVRAAWEYKSGHAKQARNIPLSQLRLRLQEIPRDREVLLMCLSGHRGKRAATFLQQQGVARVVNVKGGIFMWWVHRLPME